MASGSATEVPPNFWTTTNRSFYTGKAGVHLNSAGNFYIHQLKRCDENPRKTAAATRGIALDLSRQMQPTVLILEARKEVSEALASVIASANFVPVVVSHLERLGDLAITPAAIIVRIAFESASDPPHAAIERLGRNRPPVVAIAWEENELEEARRLKCDVILHAPRDISRLCETLTRLIQV